MMKEMGWQVDEVNRDKTGEADEMKQYYSVGDFNNTIMK